MALVPAVAKRRLLSMAMFRGGGLFHVLAFAVQPTIYLKRMSTRRGFLGSSTVWMVIGVFVHGSATFKRVTGRQTEVIDVSGLGPGRFMHITTAEPMTRKRRRRLAKQGVAVPTLQDQKAYGRLWAAKADAAKRAS